MSTSEKLESCLKIAISGNQRIDSKAKSFDSILKKSIHFKDDRFRDSLILITQLAADDNRLSLYVNNLNDLKKMFETLTPILAVFLDDCFYYTEFSKNITEVPWLKGEQCFVFSWPRSFIEKRDATREITENTSFW